MSPLPLFVLPMVLMPGEIQELRVFEPRYRQMLDDCLLDDRNFGLVLNDPFTLTNHWDAPQNHGCEAEILHHETKGSNHFLKIVGRRRFTVQEVIEPALPPFDHPMMDPLTNAEGVDPDLQSMLEFIPEEVGHSKLYISAEVDYIDPLESSQQQGSFLVQRNNDVRSSFLCQGITVYGCLNHTLMPHHNGNFTPTVSVMTNSTHLRTMVFGGLGSQTKAADQQDTHQNTDSRCLLFFQKSIEVVIEMVDGLVNSLAA